MLNHILSRWKRTRADTLATRPAGPLPTGQRAPDSLLQNLRRLLPGEVDPWQARASEQERLPLLRAEFEHCLSGVPVSEELQCSIQRARRVDDFWHLRGWLYTAVARAHSQAEAEARLARLSPHFAGPLDGFFMPGPAHKQ